MNIFHRKSTWDRVLDGVTAAATSGGARRVAKVALGVVGGAATATAVSAAVSSAREQEQK